MPETGTKTEYIFLIINHNLTDLHLFSIKDLLSHSKLSFYLIHEQREAYE